MDVMVKNYKSLTLVMVSGFALSAAAFGAETAATEIAPLQRVLPNSYSKVEMYNKNEQSYVKPKPMKTGFEYVLGSHFFDKLVDASVTVGAHKKGDSAKMNLSEVEVDGSVSAINFRDKLITLDPYVKVELPAQTDHDVTNGRFGAKLASSYKMPTDAGVFGLAGHYDLAGVFSREPKNVEVYAANGELVSTNDAEMSKKMASLKLAENPEGHYEVAPESLGLRQELVAGVNYEPTNFIPGLTVEAKARYRVIGTPRMEYSEDSNKVAAKTVTALALPSYDQADRLAYLFGAKYKINDAFYVKNEFTLYNQKELDSAGVKKFAYENLLVVGANLF
jgi:hypothetical protein